MEFSNRGQYLNILRRCVSSPYWLFIALAGAFFCFFALNRGGVNSFIEVGIGFVILNIVAGEYKLKNLPVLYFIIFVVCAYLLILSLIVEPQHSHWRWMKYMIHMLGIVFTIHCLAQKQVDSRLTYLFALVIPLCVCWQFIAKYVFQMPTGTFTNIHYLASFAVLSLPTVFFFFRITQGWFRFLFLGVGLMAADLLFQTGSRPTVLGLAIGVAVILVFLSSRRIKWVGLFSAIFIVAALYLTQYAGIVGRFQELFSNLLSEERFELWYRAWNALANNSIADWLFGHGIDKFHVIYSGPKVLQPTILVFPHFFGLELVYLNGIIGAVLIMGGLAYLGVSAVIAAKRHHDHSHHDPGHVLMLKCLIVAFVSWFFHSSLNFPFYSKYAQYPLGFILGALLMVLVQKYPAAAQTPNGPSGCSRKRMVDAKAERQR